MKLFKKAENQMAYAKIGFLGFPKSGKTYTATEIAIGIAKLIETKKPIAFADTETGSDYMIPRVKKFGFDMIIFKSRAFQDLIELVKEAQKESEILIIDSITHFWTDLIESYAKKKNRTRLQFQDWGIIKPTWRQFTDLYLTSPLHIIICGRAGYEYDYFVNDEGKKELEKTGTKMKAETEFGFEPSLLIEMQRVQEDKKDKNFVHRAWVLGDRAQVLDGKYFDDPTFENFLPHFQALAIGGKHVALDTVRDSTAMFTANSEGQPEWKQREIMKKVALETIQDCMVELYPGQTKDDKQNKALLLRTAFNTRSWTDVENRELAELQDRAHLLEVFSTGFPDYLKNNPDLSIGDAIQSMWDAVVKEDREADNVPPTKEQKDLFDTPGDNGVFDEFIRGAEQVMGAEKLKAYLFGAYRIQEISDIKPEQYAKITADINTIMNEETVSA